MKGKIVCMLLVVLALVVSGCAANSAMPPAGMTPVPEMSPMPTPTQAAQAEIITPVGKRAEIHVGGTRLTDGAYYVGMNENEMVFPLVEVAQALGFTAQEPTNTGNVEMTIRKEGVEDVVVRYARPGQGPVADAELTVMRGAEAVDVGDARHPIINDALYVPEGFLDRALHGVNVTYDGETMITIAPKG